MAKGMNTAPGMTNEQIAEYFHVLESELAALGVNRIASMRETGVDYSTEVLGSD